MSLRKVCVVLLFLSVNHYCVSEPNSESSRNDLIYGNYTEESQMEQPPPNEFSSVYQENEALRVKIRTLQESVELLKDYGQEMFEEKERLRMHLTDKGIKCADEGFLSNILQELVQHRDEIIMQEMIFSYLRELLTVGRRAGLDVDSCESSVAFEQCMNEKESLKGDVEKHREMLDEMATIKMINVMLQENVEDIKNKKVPSCKPNEKYEFRLAHMQNEIDYLYEYYVINTKILFFELIDEMREIRKHNQELVSKIGPMRRLLQSNLNEKCGEINKRNGASFESHFASRLLRDLRGIIGNTLELQKSGRRKRLITSQAFLNYELQLKDVRNENRRMEDEARIRKMQDVSIVQYSVNDYKFHKNEYKALLEVLSNIKDMQLTHRQLKSALTRFNENNQEQLAIIENNWEMTNETCSVAVYEKEKKIERMSRMTKKLADEVEQLNAKLKQSTANCKGNMYIKYEEKKMATGRGEEDVKILNTTSNHTDELSKKSSMYDHKAQKINQESLHHVAAIDEIIKDNHELNSILKDIETFWKEWDTELSGDAKRRRNQESIDKSIQESKIAQAMKKIRQIDEEKTKMWERRDERVSKTVAEMKLLIEKNPLSTGSTSGDVETFDEIIDTIDVLKVQSIKDDGKISDLSAQLDHLMSDVLQSVEMIEKESVKSRLLRETKMMAEFLTKKDAALKARSEKIDAQLEAILKGREKFLAHKAEFTKQPMVYHMGDDFQAEHSRCEKRIGELRMCETEMKAIEALKRSNEELTRQATRCRPKFSLFPMLIG